MRRRDLTKAFLLTASTTLLADPAARAKDSCTVPCYPPTPAEGVNKVAPSDLRFPPGNVLRWGADRTGSRDSTLAIQRAVNVAWACGNYGSPWTGRGGATPVIVFPPGRYRITDTIVVPTGVTIRGVAHPANTESYTRIIMDSDNSDDNRNRPIFRFSRTTLNHAILMNSAITSCIQDLEFWYVTVGGTFDRPLARGIPFGRYPDGGCLMFDVDSSDTRIINCVFQHAPAAIRIKGVTKQRRKRGDGWPGNRGVRFYVVNCEFDASCTHVYATDSELDLQFKECQFFGAMHRYENCTGDVVYQSGRWHGKAYVDAATVGNNFERFTLKAADVEIGGPRQFVVLDKARLVDISQNSALGGASATSWIEIANADGGCIVSNAINNSGCNAAVPAGQQNLVAAIKLIDCQNVLVESNNVTATRSGDYNGFGILSVSNRRAGRANFINGNSVSAPYKGGKWRRQGRFVNVTEQDVLGINYCADSESPRALARALPVESVQLKSGNPMPRVEHGGVVLFVDSSDGNLKVRFPDGAIRTLASGR